MRIRHWKTPIGQTGALPAGLRHAAAVFCLLILCSGCVSWFVDEVEFQVGLPPNVDEQTAMHCLEKTAMDLAAEGSHWSRRITLRDAATGAIETGDYSSNDIVGFRLRARTDFEDGRRVTGTIKGIGLYYNKIDTEGAVALFKGRLENCLWSKAAVSDDATGSMQ